MNSPFGWPGGKQALKKVLLELIPKHQAYVEVFCGSAKLLFAKEPSRWEVINDVNDDLLNFFRVVKHRSSELAEALEREFVGKALFTELMESPKLACEIERAAQFIYLTWHSFGSQGYTFASHRIEHLEKMSHPIRKSMSHVRDILDKTAARLVNVLVDRRDFADCIDRYDSRDTFFYLDPPYTAFGSNGRYEPMTEERFRELFAILKKIRGKFLLSLDDAPIVRELARGFRVKRVRVRYTMASVKNGKVSPELLIANYPLTPQNRSNSQNPHDAHKRNRNSATRSYSPQHVSKIKSDSATQEL